MYISTPLLTTLIVCNYTLMGWAFTPHTITKHHPGVAYHTLGGGHSHPTPAQNQCLHHIGVISHLYGGILHCHYTFWAYSVLPSVCHTWHGYSLRPRVYDRTPERLSQRQQYPFNGPLSGTTRVSRYQKGKTNLDLPEQEIVSGSGISWAICKSAPRP